MCSPRSGQSDLAFRADETRALLDGLGIDLDAVHVGRLVERTEGWAAGLRLAALELQGAADPTGFVDAFSGDDHAVAAYLLDEVIDRLAPELLDFLVRVSILDVVSAELADALTGGRNGAATLAELAASNLFVQAVGPAVGGTGCTGCIADVLRTPDHRASDAPRPPPAGGRVVPAPGDAAGGRPLRAARRPLAAGRGAPRPPRRSHSRSGAMPRDLDMLLSAVPRDALLSHPELAAALAGARIIQGSPAEARGADRRGPRGRGPPPRPARGAAARRPGPDRDRARPRPG